MKQHIIPLWLFAAVPVFAAAPIVTEGVRDLHHFPIRTASHPREYYRLFTREVKLLPLRDKGFSGKDIWREAQDIFAGTASGSSVRRSAEQRASPRRESAGSGGIA